MANSGTHSLFFYGTLVHPRILARVIGSNGDHLNTQDALLLNHTRHHVVGEDYPAVVEASAGKAILGRELSETESRVQGALVQGLTDEDVAYLDEFEGNEYERRKVVVTTLASGMALSAETYIWTSPLSRLSPSLWSFEDFLRDSAHKWVGAEGEAEYAEVDRRREMRGDITPTPPNGVQEVMDKVLNEGGQPKFAEFGRSLAQKYWSFEHGWINVNHGSYGAAPVPVIEAMRAIQDRSNVSPDRFLRLDYIGEHRKLRERLAGFVGCDRDDLVLVPSATTGVNTVLRSLTALWEKRDKLLFFSSTIYNACSATLQFVVDTHPHLAMSLVPVNLTYPIPHADVLAATKAAIEEAEKDGSKVRLALVDAISSNPGVVVPWEEMVKLFKAKNVVSLVDAAHQIGQLPVNLKESQPSMWISNCHKWLHSHRGGAVLYVSKPYQHLMHSIPTGLYYRHRPTSSSEGTPEWVNEFEWNSTMELSPLLSIDAALDFRQNVLGGEERIYKHCHDLAIEGGELVAKALGTETMRNKEGEGELVGTMINVRLPLNLPDEALPADEQSAIKLKQAKYIIEKQIKHFNTIVPPFLHGGVWWTRLSAQVYNEIADFEYLSSVLIEVCERVNSGKWETEILE